MRSERDETNFNVWRESDSGLDIKVCFCFFGNVPVILP